MRMRIFISICIVFFNTVSTWAQGERVLGQLILQLHPGVQEEQLNQSFNQAGIESIAVETIHNRLRIFLLHFDPQAITAETILQECKRLPEVAIAQYNHYVEFRGFPDDPSFELQWNLYNDASTGGIEDADVDAEEAWNLSTGGWTKDGDTIVIAIVDDGFYLPHNDIVFRKNWDEIADNGIDDDNNGYVDDYDGWNSLTNDDELPVFSHGTHVSGIAGARGDNLLGVSGINWYSEILPISIGAGSVIESNVVESYGYIFDEREQYNLSDGSEGSFIVATNASFGIDNADPEDYPIWCAMYDSLGSLGIISTGATANSNVNIDVVGDMPTACNSDYLITVNSTNKTDNKSSSGFGIMSIDLGAPGSLIYSTITGNTYNYQSGTSMAAPHVAGTVALMLSYACASFLDLYKSQPELAASVLKQCILDGTDPLPDLDSITVSGGRLNVNNAMLLLQGYCDTMTAVLSEPTSAFGLYPNPANQYTQIRLDGYADYSYAIFDMWGRKQMENRINNHQGSIISLENLSAGVYLVTVFTPSGIKMETIQLVIEK